MEPASFDIRFPMGSLPANGFRCPQCGEEAVLSPELRQLEHLAARLGLYGLQDARRRKLQRTGNSITVSLDPRLVREVLRGAGPGDEVEVGRQGDAIVIRAVED